MRLRIIGCSLAIVFGWMSIGIADDEAGLTAEQQQAVEALKALGGNVMPIAQNDDRLDVTLHLTDQDVTDEHLALVAQLPKVAWLNLAGTNITDAGLQHLAEMTMLEKLHLEKTAITDSGLEQLTKLKSLVYLNLYSTKVTDAGLQHLHGLKSLKRLYVWQTECTPAGIMALRVKFSPLEVVGALELKPVEEEAPAEAEEEAPAEEEEEAEQPAAEEEKTDNDN